MQVSPATPARCPSCGAPWPAPVPASPALRSIACPRCFGVFVPDAGAEAGWTLLSPLPSAASSAPVPLDTELVLPDGETYRVIGFGEWSYEEEHGRDQFVTYRRREFTLAAQRADSTELRIAGTQASRWWIARPVPAADVTRGANWNERRWSGRTFLALEHQGFAADLIIGVLGRRFNWSARGDFTTDYLSGPFGPGGWILIGQTGLEPESLWVGEFVDPSAIPDVLRKSTVSGVAPQPISPPPPQLAAVHSPAASIDLTPAQLAKRWMLVIGAALLIIGLIGGVSYYRERAAKPVATHWVSCPSPPVTLPVPQEAGSLELRASQPQGAVFYEIRFDGNEGTAVRSFLDMKQDRRSREHEIPGAVRQIELSCRLISLPAGVTTWPVSLRFLR